MTETKILVTGSSGLVGSAVYSHLAPDHTVFGISRSGGGGGLAADLAEAGTVALLQERLPVCSVIVHSAAHISHEPHGRQVIDSNVHGTLAVLELARRWQAYVVFLSSIQVIGIPNQAPITEDHSTRPLTTYHASKLFGEHLVSAAQAYGVDGVSLRLTAPVGVNMPLNRILPVFARRAAQGEPLVLAGQGGRRQDFVEVEDLARLVRLCVGRRPTGVYNAGSGQSISNLELAQLCLKTLSSRSELQFSGQPDAEEGRNWQISMEKSARDLGHVPRTDLGRLIHDLASRS